MRWGEIFVSFLYSTALMKFLEHPPPAALLHDHDLSLASRREREAEKEMLLTQHPRAVIGPANGLKEVIGSANGLKDVFRLVDVVASSTCTVMIQGETGTGKEGV